MYLSQQRYTEQMVQRYLTGDAPQGPCDSPMDENVTLSAEQSPEPGTPDHDAMAPHRVWYGSAVGALLWLAGGTRPDITYAVGILARFCSNPGAAHRAALQRLLRYVRDTARYCLCLTPSSARHVEVYSDASWSHRNSVSGGLILYGGVPVVWWSRRQKSVSASTAEAEYFAAGLASREGVWVIDFLEDIGFRAPAPTPLYLDSKAAIDLANDPAHFKLTKHILRHAYELRDRVARGVYSPSYVVTTLQLADVLTKAMRPGPHRLSLDAILSTTDAPSRSPPLVTASSARP